MDKGGRGRGGGHSRGRGGAQRNAKNAAGRNKDPAAASSPAPVSGTKRPAQTSSTALAAPSAAAVVPMRGNKRRRADAPTALQPAPVIQSATENGESPANNGLLPDETYALGAKSDAMADTTVGARAETGHEGLRLDEAIPDHAWPRASNAEKQSHTTSTLVADAIDAQKSNEANTSSEDAAAKEARTFDSSLREPGGVAESKGGEYIAETQSNRHSPIAERVSTALSNTDSRKFTTANDSANQATRASPDGQLDAPSTSATSADNISINVQKASSTDADATADAAASATKMKLSVRALHESIRQALECGVTAAAPSTSSRPATGRAGSWGPGFGLTLPSRLSVGSSTARRSFMEAPVSTPLNPWYLTAGMPVFSHTTSGGANSLASYAPKHSEPEPLAVALRKLLDSEKAECQDLTTSALKRLN